MAADEVFARHRLLLFYKGDISALMLFAQQSNGSVCFPEALPALSSPLDPEEFDNAKISVHPAILINRINQLMGFDNELLRIESGEGEPIDAPGGVIIVHMARFMRLDPPHKLLQSRDCHLRTLPELRGRPPAEMELLRRAYTRAMEG